MSQVLDWLADLFYQLCTVNNYRKQNLSVGVAHQVCDLRQRQLLDSVNLILSSKLEMISQV